MKKKFLCSIVLIMSSIFWILSLISCGIKDAENLYERKGDKIYFGRYPQTKVNAAETNGLESIKFDESTWTSYEYYIKTIQTDFMYYKDVDVDNDGLYDYRGVYFSQYRPRYTRNSSSKLLSEQDDNLYITKYIYWFKYEPVEWKILNEDSGKMLIVSNLILDSQDYCAISSSEQFEHNGGIGYSNNYEFSSIRKFLNETFYDTAFSELQKSIIETTLVDNSLATTGYNANQYICNNTNDKIFLLSYKEIIKYFRNTEARMTQGTNYAKCQGLSVSINEPFVGNSNWWIRSPSYNNPDICDVVWSHGSTNCNYSINNTGTGVRPACNIVL